MKAPPPRIPSLREIFGPVRGKSEALLQLLVLSFAIEACLIFSPMFMQVVTDDVLTNGDRDLLTMLVLGFGLLLAFQVLMFALRSWVIVTASASVGLQWQARLFSHLVRLPLEYFERRNAVDVAARFASANTIRTTFTSVFIEGLVDGVMLIVTVGMLLFYSPALAAFPIVSLLLYSLLRWSQQTAQQETSHALLEHGVKQQSSLLETIRGVRSVRLFEAEELRRHLWQAHLISQVNADVRSQYYGTLFRGSTVLIYGVERLLLVLVGVNLVISQSITLGMFLAVLGFREQFSARAVSVTDKLLDLRLMRVQKERLADIALTEEEPPAQPVEILAEEEAPSIKLEGLSFRYSRDGPWIVRNFNLEVSSGEFVVLTGASGCGKTTLLKLIVGILQPNQGRVSFKSTGGRVGKPSDFRRHFGVVMQDDVLFPGSIVDNIAFFDDLPDMQWVQECARAAAIHDQIAAMPMRYQTRVGETGSTLSGGQQQRILIARALYRRPKVLLLDEATSHLDSATEKQINRLIKSMNVTRVSIAHRRESIALADRVITLDDISLPSETKMSAISV